MILDRKLVSVEDEERNMLQISLKVLVLDSACHGLDPEISPLYAQIRQLTDAALLSSFMEQLALTHGCLEAVESSFEKYEQVFTHQQQIVEARKSQLSLLESAITSKRQSSESTYTFIKQASEIVAEANEMDDEYLAFEMIQCWKSYLGVWVEELERLKLQWAEISEWYERKACHDRTGLSEQEARSSSLEDVVTMLKQMKMIELRIDLIRVGAEEKAGRLMSQSRSNSDGEQ